MSFVLKDSEPMPSNRVALFKSFVNGLAATDKGVTITVNSEPAGDNQSRVKYIATCDTIKQAQDVQERIREAAHIYRNAEAV